MENVDSLQEMPKESSETIQTSHKIELIKITGNFARSSVDEIPPMHALRFVSDTGEFATKKKEELEDLTIFWRNKERALAFILLVCGLILFIIMLGAMTKYFDWLFQIWIFIAGFFKSILPQLPKII